MRGKIVVPFLALTVLTALVATFIVTRLVAGSARERFTNQLYESSRLAASAVVDQETAHLSVLRLMVFTNGLDAALRSGDVAQMDTLLRPLAGNAGVEIWAVLDDRGRAWLTNVAHPEASAGAYDFVVAEWRGETAIDAVITQARDAAGDKMVGIKTVAAESYFYTVAPVTDADGRMLGAVLVGTRLTTLLDVLRERSNAQEVLLTQEGAFRASTLLVDPTSFELSADQAATVDESPARSVVIAGEDYEALYTPLLIRQQPVGVLVTLLPADFVVSAEATSRNAIAAVFLLLVGATTAVGFWLAGAISAPLGRLRNVTQQVAAGDLDQATGIDSGDEIGGLARDFDQMTAQLRHRTSQSQALQIATRELYEQALQRGEQLAAANQQLAAAQSHLIQREKIALMGQVASHVAQDVRAPLTAALTLIDLIEMEDGLTADVRDHLSQIRANAEHAGRLLGDIDRFARPSAVEHMLVDLRMTIKAVLESQTAALLTARVSGASDLPAAAVYATIDPNRVQQALGALMTQRLRVIPAEGALTLGLSADPTTSLASMTVADTGPTISPAEAQGFFDPIFDMAADTLSLQLERAVSYGLIAEHGGRIDIHTDPTSSLRFTVWLPLAGSQEPLAPESVTHVHVQRAPAIDPERPAP